MTCRLRPRCLLDAQIADVRPGERKRGPRPWGRDTRHRAQTKWSHGFPTMETHDELETLRSTKRVAFQWSHGFSTMETQGRQCDRLTYSAGFNGATVFQPWRREVEFVSERTDGLKAFQWSHGFSTMETRARQGERIQKRQVSMEPRFFNHGDSGPPRAPITVRTDMVSMEPRFFNHGDRPRWSGRPAQGKDGFNGATVFQPWRRKGRGNVRRGGTWFQWSHGFSTMETGACAGRR